MNQQRIRILLPMIYGVALAVVAMTVGGSAVGVFAVVGGLAVAACFVLTHGDDRSPRDDDRRQSPG